MLRIDSAARRAIIGPGQSRRLAGKGEGKEKFGRKGGFENVGDKIAVIVIPVYKTGVAASFGNKRAQK
jgi:hypothetical protein